MKPYLAYFSRPFIRVCGAIRRSANALELRAARKLSRNSYLLQNLARGTDVVRMLEESGLDIGFSLTILRLAGAARDFHFAIKFTSLPYYFTFVGESLTNPLKAEALDSYQNYPPLKLSDITVERFIRFRFTIRKLIKSEPFIFVVLSKLLEKTDREPKFEKWGMEAIRAIRKFREKSRVPENEILSRFGDKLIKAIRDAVTVQNFAVSI